MLFYYCMYKYLEANYQHELLINKSRFITYLFCISNKSEAMTILEELKKQHPKANHHCYAYLLAENTIQKYYDDGEPAKTAGWPMLNVLLKNNMDDILAVVVRYFGGIKLGAGGLTRAYRSSVSQALNNSKLSEKTEVPLYSLAVDYSQSNQIKSFLLANCHLLTVNYHEKVEFKFYCLQPSSLIKLKELNVGFDQKIHSFIKVDKS